MCDCPGPGAWLAWLTSKPVVYYSRCLCCCGNLCNQHRLAQTSRQAENRWSQIPYRSTTVLRGCNIYQMHWPGLIHCTCPGPPYRSPTVPSPAASLLSIHVVHIPARPRERQRGWAPTRPTSAVSSPWTNLYCNGRTYRMCMLWSRECGAKHNMVGISWSMMSSACVHCQRIPFAWCSLPTSICLPASLLNVAHRDVSQN